MILLSRSEEIILLTVYKLHDNAYGVTIREQINDDIGRYWPFGVIYKTLKKLKVKGYVEKIASAPLSERGGRTRYYYEITPAGISALKKILNIHASIWRGIQDFHLEKKAK
ncbi:MAG: PadR family transcriptional regulator [Candidatus Aminicenantes bacterium]|nr:MAG: PadR family transcriptional regulator [Candidatus Aminicenantes bacterium]